MQAQDVDAIVVSPHRPEGLLAAGDALVVAFCFLAARPALESGSLMPLAPGASLPWSLVGMALGVSLLLWLFRLGHYDQRRPLWQETGDIVGAGCILAAIDLGVAFAEGRSPAAPLVCWGLVLLLLPGARVGVRQRLDTLGLWRRPTVVVGTGDNAVQAAQALLSEPGMGLPVIAFATLPGQDGAPDGLRRAGALRVQGDLLPVMAAGRLLTSATRGFGAPHVVIAPEAHEMPAALELVARLAQAGCELDFVPPLGDLPTARARLARFIGGNLAAIQLRDRLSTPLFRVYKRAFDLAVGGAIALLAAPLLALIALAILILDGRPVLFWQRRIGMNGRPFACLKFRTMAPDAETRLQVLLAGDGTVRAEWERDRKLRHDPRVTRTGTWLRRTSLDELPQLWNVLRGEMSLVGPRPVVEDELARYGAHAALYLKTRPGLSGLWQVSGRNDLDYLQRVSLDCHYVRNWTPWWDVALLLATVRVVLSRRGAY